MEKVLVIAAHPDDEILGAGGAILRHIIAGDDVHILIVTEGSSTQYPGQSEMVLQKEAEAKEAASILGLCQANLYFGGLPDMQLDSLPVIKINKCIESAVRSVQPTIVYTHSKGDINLDHRLVFESTIVVCRPYSAPFVKNIYSYFVPSSSEWGFQPFDPNYFVDISGVIDIKLEAMGAYKSEARVAPHPRSIDSLRSIFASFGSIIGCHYAEPFRLIRSIQRG